MMPSSPTLLTARRTATRSHHKACAARMCVRQQSERITQRNSYGDEVIGATHGSKSGLRAEGHDPTTPCVRSSALEIFCGHAAQCDGGP